MVRILSLGFLFGAHALPNSEASPKDASLFIGPFYRLNNSSKQEADGAVLFRQAYCDARHIADTESFTNVFNTAVTSQPRSDGGVYFTREEFPDGEAFNWHIQNVSDVFSRALGVASATGFYALGTQADLDAISDFTEKNNVMNFVKDSRSFKWRQFKQERYFALDFFLTLNDAKDLPFFEKVWGTTRDLAATFPDILAFAMGVHKASDGTVTVQLQETFVNADAYQRWSPKSAEHVEKLLSVATLATDPNPFAMVGTAADLTKMEEHCQALGCVQYIFDDCEGVGTGKESKVEATPVDASLFIGPFYRLNNSSTQESDGAVLFRQAYCDARHIADTESFTNVFNTAVTSQPRSDGGVYFTREEFPDGEAFNWHIQNVSDVFSRALGVASATGFYALGTQADLDAISDFTEKNNVMNFVKDSRSFKWRQFKQERYFALDFFLTLNDAKDLPFFEKVWGTTRDLAATFPDILAFAMGVHKASDGTVTVQLQETFVSADAYQRWSPKSAEHVEQLLSVATLATDPNPFAMVGTAADLTKMEEHCQALGCVQYIFDDCEGVSTGNEFVV